MTQERKGTDLVKDDLEYVKSPAEANTDAGI